MLKMVSSTSSSSSSSCGLSSGPCRSQECLAPRLSIVCSLIDCCQTNVEWSDIRFNCVKKCRRPNQPPPSEARPYTARYSSLLLRRCMVEQRGLDKLSHSSGLGSASCLDLSMSISLLTRYFWGGLADGAVKVTPVKSAASIYSG